MLFLKLSKSLFWSNFFMYSVPVSEHLQKIVKQKKKQKFFFYINQLCSFWQSQTGGLKATGPSHNRNNGEQMGRVSFITQQPNQTCQSAAPSFFMTSRHQVHLAKNIEVKRWNQLQVDNARADNICFGKYEIHFSVHLGKQQFSPCYSLTNTIFFKSLS